MTEGVAVGLLHGATAGRPDMREHEAGRDLARELAEIAVVPGRFDAAEDGWLVTDALPPTSKPSPFVVSAPSLGVQALVDEGVLGPVEQVFEQHR